MASVAGVLLLLTTVFVQASVDSPAGASAISVPAGLANAGGGMAAVRNQIAGENPHAVTPSPLDNPTPPAASAPAIPMAAGSSATAISASSRAATAALQPITRGSGNHRKTPPKIIREITQDRTANSQAFVTTAGTKMIRLYAGSKFYKPAGSSSYVPIGDSFSPVAGRPGVLSATHNSWTATVAPSDASGGMVNLGIAAASIAMSPLHASTVAPKQSGTRGSANTVTYPNLWHGVNATYVLSNQELDEQLVLRDRYARTSFAFAVSGAAVSYDPQTGGAKLSSGATLLGTIPAPTVTSRQGSIADAKPRLAVVQAGDSTVVRLTISPTWLAHLPAKDFPVVVDPTVEEVPGATNSTFSAVSLSSTGQSETNDLRVGWDANGDNWRAAVHWNYEQWLGYNPQYQVTNAYIWSGVLQDQPGSCGYVDFGQSTCTTPLTISPYDASVPPSWGLLAPTTPNIQVTDDQGTVNGPVDLSSYYASWFGANLGQGQGSMGFALNGGGAPGQVKVYPSDITLDLTVLQPPPADPLTSPQAGAIVATTTPTLVAPTVTQNEGNSVSYDFRISTSPSMTGAVVDSNYCGSCYSLVGGLVGGSVQYTPPPGVLHDGVTYYAEVLTNVSDALVPLQPKPTEFQVNLRLGSGGPAPTDTVGALPGGSQSPSAGAPSPQTPPGSVTVNMVDGNLSFGLSNHSVSTVSGPVNIALSYNSLTQDSAQSSQPGLLGQYYSDVSGQHVTNNPALLVGERTDSSIDLAGPPVNGLAAGQPYVAQWTGVIDVPNAAVGGGCANGSAQQDCWGISAASDGGMQVIIDGTTVVNTWTAPSSTSSSPSFSTPYDIALTGGEHTISIQSWEPANSPDVAQLSMQDTRASGSVPDVGLSGWLSSAPQQLPSGWSLSPGGSGVQFTGLTDAGGAVAVTQADGSSLDFGADGNGGFTPPAGSQDLLTAVVGGGYDLATPDNQLYFFAPSGTLQSVTNTTDDLHPAALTYTYSSASPGVIPELTGITDPVSGRSVNLVYFGESNPPSACPTPPSGYAASPSMLCAITYWDGTESDFYYDTHGRLAEVVNPGGETSQFGYDTTSGLLDQIRDPLSFDAVAAGVAPDSPTSDTTIGYTMAANGSYQVVSVTSPQPTSAAAQPERTYAYYPDSLAGGGGYSTVNIAGFSPTVGYAEKLTYSAEGRVLSTTRPSGAASTVTSSTIWNNDAQPVVSVNGAGQQTTTVYNLVGLVTDAYGPAPTACFTTTSPYTPVANPQGTPGCGVAVPHATKSYDQANNGTPMTSLAATYWGNSYLAGPAKLHGLGTGDTSGNFLAKGADFPTSVTTGSPTWSVQYTGTIPLSATSGGSGYGFELQTHQHASLYIDDTLVAAATGNGSGGAGIWEPGSVVNIAQGGSHRIRVVYVGSGSTNSKNGFNVKWVPLGKLSYSALPITSLSPDFGLVTTSTDPDGKVTNTDYADTGDSITPAYGLSTATTTYPGGYPYSGTGPAPLTTTTTYETPGATGTYLRKIATTLPAGDPTPGLPADGATSDQTTYSYYGGSAGPFQAACGLASTSSQGGLESQKTDPAPAAGQPSVVTQFIYDQAGRIVGTRSGSSTGISSVAWNCTSYDSRGRVTQQTYAAHNGAPVRTITYGYSFYGSPLATYVGDGTNYVFSVVDLLGRVATYIDAAAVADSSPSTVTTYNQAGQITSVVGPQGTITDSYDPDSGSLSAVSLNGTTEATDSYSPATAQLTGVTYGNGTKLAITYDSLGQEYSTIFTGPSGGLVAGDAVVRSPGGRVGTEYTDTSSGMVNLNSSGGADYTYDGTGRLVQSYGVNHSITYSYGTNAPSDNCADPNQGMDTNITSQTTTPYAGGSAVSQDYCYNLSDQLTSEVSNSGGTNSNSFTYDDEGNTTQLGATTLGYDASNRNTTISATGAPTTTYSLDALDRTFTRTEGSSATTYAYCGFNSAACATVDSGGTTLQAFVPLPGGVLLTTQSSGNIWSYPNIHGDMIVTANSAGATTSGPFTYNPFGAQDPSGTPIQNAGSDASYGAFGQSQTLTDSGAATNGVPIVQMGARPYAPTLGRFLSVDPIEGGCSNAYAYVFGDPVNSSDPSGKSWCFTISAQTSIDIAHALEDGAGVSDILAEALAGVPGGDVIAAIAASLLNAAAAVYAPVFEAAGEFTKKSAGSGDARLPVLITTLLGFIPTGIVPIPTDYTPSRYTPPTDKSLCDQAKNS